MPKYKDLISIIVPVYNAQKYLDKCIQSVLKQTIFCWELLLIDDGSTDKSYDICNGYANKDARIKCIHTENYGRVHARKIGMQNATGSLITFLDSDDWIELDTLQKMYTEMCKHMADCVIAGYIETSLSGEKAILNPMPQGVYQGKQLQDLFLTHMLCYSDFCELGIQPFLWNKLFRREIIEKYIEEVDERIVIGEDVVCVFPALLEAKTVIVMDEAYYHYCIHAGSTMQTSRTEQEEIDNIRLQYFDLNKFFSGVSENTCLTLQLNRYIIHHVLVRALPYFVCNIKDARNIVFGEIPRGCKVLLYGAGAFGQSIYNFMMENHDNQIIAWCDRDYRKYQMMKLPVVSIEDALKNEYDFVFVSVMSRQAFEAIQLFLISKGVIAQRIVWMKTEELANLQLSDVLGIGM